MKRRSRHSWAVALIDEVFAVGAVLVFICGLLWLLNLAGDGLAGFMWRLLEAGKMKRTLLDRFEK